MQKHAAFHTFAATLQRLRFPFSNPDFHILLSYEPIVMDRPFPLRVLELEIKAHYDFRKQLVDFH